ncbi:37301_t:CDS:1, partial [Gigaspora margarita]
MTKRANEVKNIHFLTLVLNYINNPFTFFFVFLVCKLWKRIAESYDFWESFCDSLGFDGPTPKVRKYKTYHSVFLKNVHQLCTIYRQFFGERQISIEQINFKLDVLQDYCLDHWNFYRPTPIFKTRANYDFCEYLVDEIELLVNSSIVKGAQ